ncbi:MAG: hypothetical protein ACR2PG_17395 [Hyphomicrobiaceae bacterium]
MTANGRAIRAKPCEVTIEKIRSDLGAEAHGVPLSEGVTDEVLATHKDALAS